MDSYLWSISDVVRQLSHDIANASQIRIRIIEAIFLCTCTNTTLMLQLQPLDLSIMKNFKVYYHIRCYFQN